MSDVENPPLLAMPNYTGRDCVTLRDYFAAKAMQCVFSKTLDEAKKFAGDDVGKIVAQTAYEIADAMLAERVRK